MTSLIDQQTGAVLIECHPIATLFPLMEGEEFEAFKADIAAHGVREPVWLHPDGRLLDGRNRYLACHQLGMKPPTRVWHGQESVVALVLSLNLQRRHLTSSQRAAIAVELLPLLEAAAQHRQRATWLAGRDKDGTPIFGAGNHSRTEGERGKASEQAAALVGTNGRYVAQAKKLKATVPDVFASVLKGKLTLPQARQQLARQREPDVTHPLPFPEDSYAVILADPPWPFQVWNQATGNGRSAESHYPTMSLEAIRALPVGELAAENCALFLWAVWPSLPEALQVIAAWGFEYKTLAWIWVKQTATGHGWHVGMGYYTRANSELCLLAVKGRMPMAVHNELSLIVTPLRAHSQKPDEQYAKIERLYPTVPKIELFARQCWPGWEVWGNRINNNDSHQPFARPLRPNPHRGKALLPKPRIELGHVLATPWRRSVSNVTSFKPPLGGG